MPGAGDHAVTAPPDAGKLPPAPASRLAPLARALFRVRFLIWAAVLAIMTFLWATNDPVRFNQSIEGFFPSDDPALVGYTRAARSFGGDDFVFVAYEDPELWTAAGMDRLVALSDSIERAVPGVLRTESLARMPLPWKVDAAAEAVVAQPLALARILGGLATVAHEVRAAAADPPRIHELRERITAHPLFRNLLVDARGLTTALMVRLGSPDDIDTMESVRQLRARADQFTAEHGIAHAAVVGPPVLLADGFLSLEQDNRTLGWVAMALMALTMLLAVRNLWWAMLPLVAGWTTWLVIQRFITHYRLELTLSSGPIVAQTVVLCMPAASHLAMHYREARRKIADFQNAAIETLCAVAAPVAWCSITAAAGYLALLSSSVQPVFQFGITMAVGNILAGLLSYLLAPGGMWPRRGAARADADVAQVALEVGSWTTRILAHPGRALVLFVVPCLIIGTGMFWLRFESNYIRVFKSRARVAEDYRIVEDRMGGIGLAELVFPAPERVTVDWLERLRDTSRDLARVDPDLVTQVLSLADVLLAQDPQATESVPESSSVGMPGLFGGAVGPADPARVLRAKLRALSLPAYAHFLSNFWAPGAAGQGPGEMRILVRIREAAEADRKEQAFARLVGVARDRLGDATFLTGLSHLMTQITRAIITTQFQSTALSCALILLMLFLALRNPLWAVLALLPSLLSVALVLGAMGWLDLRIDMSTALVASVATGLSVDDTFHCLLRWKHELRHGHSKMQALRIAYAGAGPGVILSSAAVSLGFLALVFSEFMPTANFGWLVAVATLGGSLGNLILLPACLGFLYRDRVSGSAPAPAACSRQGPPCSSA